MEQTDWFCDQETALEERRGNENAKLVSAYFLWHCCGGSERLGGNDKLGLRRYTLDCPPPLTSCLPLSFPALSLSLSWKVEGLQLRWKGARGCKTGLEKRQFLAKVAANMDSMMVRKAGPLFGYLPKYFCKFSKYISAVCSAFVFTFLGKKCSV